MLEWITRLTHKVENQAAQSESIFRIASHYYRDIIEKEAVLANIASTDNILCIGGGICPFSAILLHELTKAKVTVIDNNNICIPKAQQIIDRLDAREYVRVFWGEGGSADLPFEQYSIIHIALQVSPMESVFLRAEKQAAPGTKFLIRRPRKQLDGIYSNLPSDLLDGCPYTAHKSARNIGSTLLYIKQECEHEDKMAAGSTSDSVFSSHPLAV